MPAQTRSMVLTVLLGALGAGCGLGDGDIAEEGESCVADEDCSVDLECVPAESANASRVCMPLP